MICPSCRAENPEKNGYCGSCGTVLNEAAVVVPRYTDGKRLVKREIVIVAGGLCAVLFAAWVAWYFLVSTKSPARVVTAFIEADRTGQFSRQQSLIANTWDSRMALSLFQNLRQQAGSSPFQNYRILQTNEGGNTASVDVELTLPPPPLPLLAPLTPPGPPGKGPNNIKLPVTFVLTRVGDEWKIDSSQTLATVLTALAAQGFQQFRLNMPNMPNLQLPNGWPGILNPPGAASPGTTPPPAAGDGSI